MRKRLSYLFPVRIKDYFSKHSGKLEISLVDGKKVLDTASSNYSYGSLQRILEYGLRQIGFDEKTQTILLLGLGGGSFIQTVRGPFKSDAHITAVEIDQDIIDIAHNEFDIGSYGNIRIVHADAMDFVAGCREKFDLVVVDIFIIDTVPDAFTRPFFLEKINSLLNPEGKLLFNLIKETTPDGLTKQMKDCLRDADSRTWKIDGVERTNILILHKKGAARKPVLQ